MRYTKEVQAEEIVFRIEGELDALTAPQLRPALDELVSDGYPRITVDLSALRLIDSSGVGALVSLYKRVRGRGGRLRIIGASQQPLAVFRLLRLDVVFAESG